VKYRVTVLTPTLVGDGRRLSPVDYMVWRDQVNVLDQSRIFRMLSKSAGPRLDNYLTQIRKATKLDFTSWGGYAQNFASRRIPFEDATYTPFWERAPLESLAIPEFASGDAGPFLPGAPVKGALRAGFVFANVKPQALRDAANRLTGERAPRRPAESIEQQAIGSGGSDRMRVFSIGDSEHGTRDAFRIYLLRLATLVPKGPGQLALGWKQAGRGAADGRRPEEGTPTFAEMASPGAIFEGEWRENDFLNGDEVRRLLRWSEPVTRAALFNAANGYAAKQLETHAQYARWTGLEALGQSVAELQQRLETVRGGSGCLMAMGWGSSYLSKSAAIGADDGEYRKLLGSLPYYARAIQTGLPFPKTRRIVFLKNKPATLAGWVELKVS
jgi:CRISPR-associated protein Csm5